MTTPTLTVNKIERLEFSGVILDDGKILNVFGRDSAEWPERIVIAGVDFWLEETDDKVTPDVDDPQRISMAWYAPA